MTPEFLIVSTAFVAMTAMNVYYHSLLKRSHKREDELRKRLMGLSVSMLRVLALVAKKEGK